MVEAEGRQRLPAGSELAVRQVVPGMDQLDNPSLPAGGENAAGLRWSAASSGHQHGGPGQGEELLVRVAMGSLRTTSRTINYHNCTSTTFMSLL